MFRFEAVAGERFYFQNLLGISNANLRIIGPNGKQTQNPTGVGDREFTAEQTGTYIVLIEGRSWDTAASRDYRFAVHRASDTLAGTELDGTVSPPDQNSVEEGKSVSVRVKFGWRGNNKK